MNLKNHYAVVRPDLSATAVAVTPSIYEQLNQRFDDFKGHVLIAVHEFENDWDMWERHPAGDEVVVLMSGAATLVLQTEAGEQRHELTESGSYVIVPKNSWHTAKVQVSTRMLFFTPGAGTEHRPLSDE